MNGGEFKNVLPVKKPRRAGKAKRFTLLNIGQILLICFLFIVITFQISGLISGLADLTRNITENFGFSPDKATAGSNQDTNINSAQAAGEANYGASENINNIINIDSDTDNINNNPEVIFILGENNGKLAVLSPDRQTVYETYDVYINTLPDYDKNLLINGIKIKTAEELNSLLEDYSS